MDQVGLHEAQGAHLAPEPTSRLKAGPMNTVQKDQNNVVLRTKKTRMPQWLFYVLLRTLEVSGTRPRGHKVPRTLLRKPSAASPWRGERELAAPSAGAPRSRSRGRSRRSPATKARASGRGSSRR